MSWFSWNVRLKTIITWIDNFWIFILDSQHVFQAVLIIINFIQWVKLGYTQITFFFFLEYEWIFKYFSGTFLWAFFWKKTKQKFPEEVYSERDE